jgi:hypothetical protein
VRYCNMIKELPVLKTKSGHPALWEEGGGCKNTGRAIIICGPSGEKVSPLYIRKRGHLSNKEHALFEVKESMHVVEVEHHREDFSVRVWKITSLSQKNGGWVATLKMLSECSGGEWTRTLPPGLEEAVIAGINKSLCYHCREPHFFQPSS